MVMIFRLVSDVDINIFLPLQRNPSLTRYSIQRHL